MCAGLRPAGRYQRWESCATGCSCLLASLAHSGGAGWLSHRGRSVDEAAAGLGVVVDRQLDLELGCSGGLQR